MTKPSNPKYATRAHREAVRRFRAQVDAGDGWCAEVVCLMPSRFILPGSRFDAAHDKTGTHYLGPAHTRCNRSEGASRGNADRNPKEVRRWVL